MPETTQQKYPAEFIERVKAAYPNSPNLIAAAEAGDQILGRYLGDDCPRSIDLETIIEMLHDGKALELYQKAIQIKTCRDLYVEWTRLAADMFGDDRA